MILTFPGSYLLKHRARIVSKDHQGVMRTTVNTKNIHRSQYFSRYLAIMLACLLEDRVLLRLKVGFSLPLLTNS